jgi:hypothetical protein
MPGGRPPAPQHTGQSRRGQHDHVAHQEAVAADTPRHVVSVTDRRTLSIGTGVGGVPVPDAVDLVAVVEGAQDRMKEQSS